MLIAEDKMKNECNINSNTNDKSNIFFFSNSNRLELLYLMTRRLCYSFNVKNANGDEMK